MSLIGRAEELKLLLSAKQSQKSELGIIYGRRRIGKTTLIKNPVSSSADLYFEGIKDLSLKEQVSHFTDQLAEQTNSMKVAGSDWKSAFDALTLFIRTGQHYVVFDELPWMASGKSTLVSLIKFYWDNKWKENPQNSLILCGSIAKFMVEHVVHSSALHNRKTFELKLGPLSAKEAKQFFSKTTSLHEITKYLMIFGGVPKYLEQIRSQYSFTQNMDKLCFSKHGFFLNEFETIFKEQFKSSRYYEKIVRLLAQGSISKEDLVKKCKISPGGGFTSYLENLKLADFIAIFNPVHFRNTGTKTSRVYLWDEWLKFYFFYIEPNVSIIAMNTRPGLFNQVTASSLDAYFGLQFEKFCHKNLISILDALEISLGDIIDFGPFFRQKSRSDGTQGLQIDLLINVKNEILYIVECKFTSKPIGTTIIPIIERKIQFLEPSKKYSIKKVLISSAGITRELDKMGYFDFVLELDVFY